MGIDLRLIPDDRVADLVEDLRRSGISVELGERIVQLTQEHCELTGIEFPQPPSVIRQIHCSRGSNKLKLWILPDEERIGGYRITMPNFGSWLPIRNRRQKRFKAEVLSILESGGAYC